MLFGDLVFCRMDEHCKTLCKHKINLLQFHDFLKLVLDFFETNLKWPHPQILFFCSKSFPYVNFVTALWNHSNFQFWYLLPRSISGWSWHDSQLNGKAGFHGRQQAFCLSSILCISRNLADLNQILGGYFITRWWFQIFFIFTPTWGDDPFWQIFFKGVETINQLSVCHLLHSK